jgi:hypothetical protein
MIFRISNEVERIGGDNDVEEAVRERDCFAA